MRYKFKAIKNDGSKYEGMTESQDKFSLFNELKAEGNILISAEEINTIGYKKYFFGIFKFFNYFNNVSILQKINFAKNLGAMTKAGLSLSRALSVIGKQTKNKRFKAVVEGINSEVRRGKTLSDAFKNYPNIFSSFFVFMTKAGEESGGLSNALSNIAFQMDKTYHLQKKIRGAMIYPAVIIFVMMTVGIIMFIFVVPGLVQTFKELNTELPFSTKLIIGLSDFITVYWPITISILIVLIVSIYFYLKTNIGSKTLDGIIIKLPLIADLVKEANSARVARTLSSLLMAGVPVAQSIQIVKDVVSNYYYRQVLEEAAKVVEKGENISSIFLKNPELYPTFVGEMMNVGEETGNMAAMLNEVAIFYETDVEERTRDLSTIIEPVLMVLIGIAVGFFAFSMITPIYSVMDTI